MGHVSEPNPIFDSVSDVHAVQDAATIVGGAIKIWVAFELAPLGLSPAGLAFVGNLAVSGATDIMTGSLNLASHFSANSATVQAMHDGTAFASFPGMGAGLVAALGGANPQTVQTWANLGGAVGGLSFGAPSPFHNGLWLTGGVVSATPGNLATSYDAGQSLLGLDLEFGITPPALSPSPTRRPSQMRPGGEDPENRRPGHGGSPGGTIYDGGDRPYLWSDNDGFRPGGGGGSSGDSGQNYLLA